MERSHNVFHSAACHICKATSDVSPIKRCSGCRLVGYCSVEHQKQHWLAHKEFCNCFKELCSMNETGRNNIFNEDYVTGLDWHTGRVQIMILVEMQLGRQLRLEERQMFLFPFVCKVCHKFSSTMKDCALCHSVSYCSTDHKVLDSDSHSEVCHSLKLCFKIDKATPEVDFLYPPVNIEIQATEILLPESMKLFIANYLNYTYIDDVTLCLASEVLTGVLSFLFVLERTKCMFSLNDTLNVHIIGSHDYESLMLCAVEVIMHWVPRLKHLKIALVGPEARLKDGDEELQSPFHPSLCSSCEETRHVVVHVEKMTYDTYCKAGQSYFKPHLIMAYNCGFHEHEGFVPLDTWAPTVAHLKSVSNVIIAFTSLTEEEAKKDIARLLGEEHKMHVVVSCEENPFKSLRPYRDWENENSGVFFVNSFISILKA